MLRSSEDYKVMNIHKYATDTRFNTRLEIKTEIIWGGGQEEFPPPPFETEFPLNYTQKFGTTPLQMPHG